MGKVRDVISSELHAWLERQKVFFVATAPLSAEGHINCSPKGCDSFRVLNPNEVAYLDLTGSGVETIAHLQENRRIVLMFCAFEGAPNIVRLHGRGEVIAKDHADFDELSRNFPVKAGTRSITKIKVTRVSDSCGFAVPFLKFVGERPTLDQWIAKKTPEELESYRQKNNRTSIDGLSGYKGR